MCENNAYKTTHKLWREIILAQGKTTDGWEKKTQNSNYQWEEHVRKTKEKTEWDE